MKHLRLATLSMMLLGACGSASPLEAYGTSSTTLTIDLGQEVRIRMGTVGPGEYVSPPTLVGSALDYMGLGSTDGQVQTPAGVTQLFRFKGVARGQTVIRFRNTVGSHPDVIDTVLVR